MGIIFDRNKHVFHSDAFAEIIKDTIRHAQIGMYSTKEELGQINVLASHFPLKP